MADKSLRVKLVIVRLLEHILNQQISHFVVLTLRVKFALTKIWFIYVYVCFLSLQFR